MVDYLRINAIGATIISCLTIIAATYLTWSLWRQGRGKLRVRLLLGMVISDIFLGIVIMVPELSYVVGRAMQTDTPVCDAFGFLITFTLFTQHMWTLAIAIATFLLLKYPLSRSTTFMDHYSWLCYPVIYGVSALHSGLWYRFYGFASSGNLCYYDTDPTSPNPDPRDLVQFIPRAFVFVVIIVLYSMLFRFLRRPDTIQLSSGFNSGGAQTGTAGSVAMAHLDDTDDEKAGGGVGVIRRMTQRLSIGKPGHDMKAEEDIPPWEKVEFVHVGHGQHHSKRLLTASPTQTQMSAFQPTISGGIIMASPPVTRNGTPRVSDAGVLADHPAPMLVRSETSSTIMDAGAGRASRSDVETIVTPQAASRAELDGPSGDEDSTDMAKRKSDEKQHMFVASSAEGEDMEPPRMSTKLPGSESSSLSDASGPSGARGLTEFFQQYQVTTDPGLLENGPGGSDCGRHRGRNGSQPMSATAYFNRQASLLMLYFPLAYMLVFSVSLVRLIYDMTTTGPPNPILTLISAWFVVSVGLIDGLVYGLAEFMVKRRVRRKMPDRM